jgi:hypothetical protein
MKIAVAALARGGQALNRLGVERADPREGKTAGTRLVESGDAIEDRCLAGAVGADERGDVAAPDLEGQIVDGGEAAEPSWSGARP